MISIYPKWVGRTSEELRQSRFPRWIAGLIDAIPPQPWLGGALVLPQNYGIAMVVSAFGQLLKRTTFSVAPDQSKIDVITRGEPGAEVNDEEPGV